jgi:hypothetical protein
MFRHSGGWEAGKLENTQNRLVLRGNATPCACWPGRCGGLRLQNTGFPDQLRDAGVEEDAWTRYMGQLQKVQRLSKACDLPRATTTSYVPLFWFLVRC